jgi:endonuclease/exonuclease/phosphatase family metal-dependent hydrolase
MLLPALQRLNADVLCLQEVNAQKVPKRKARELLAFQELIEGTGYSGFHLAVTAGANEGPADVHNLVTLSRYPIVDQRQVRHDYVAAPVHDPIPGGPAYFDRPLLQTDLELAGGEILTVINVHLRAPLASPIPGQKVSAFKWRSVEGWAEGFYVAMLKHLGQALELRLFVEALLRTDPARLLVVAGDFNCEDHGPALRLVQAAEEDTGASALAAHGLVLLDRYLPEDRRWSVLHAGRPAMLDHILANPTLYGRFRHLEAHNETLADEAVGFGKSLRSAASYHAPVVAEFAPAAT